MQAADERIYLRTVPSLSTGVTVRRDSQRTSYNLFALRQGFMSHIHAHGG